MLREPYNLNPYNSTIDTSMVQPFSFVFSGDKLGAYQIQIAENNKQETLLYSSPIIVPSQTVYDGDRVETVIPVASDLQTNTHAVVDDGRIWYDYSMTGDLTSCSYIQILYNGAVLTTSYNIYKDSSDKWHIWVSGPELGDISNEDLVWISNISNTETTSKFTFYGYVIGLGNDDNSSTYKFDGKTIQLEQNTFTLSSFASESGTFKHYTLSSTTPFLVQTSGSMVWDYIIYTSNTNFINNLKGKDLVWCVLQWEVYDGNNEPMVSNYVRNGQVIAKTDSTGITVGTNTNIKQETGVIVPIIEAWNKGSTYSRNCIIDETARCPAYEVSSTWYLYIPITYSYVDLTTLSNSIDFVIIDNIYYSVNGSITISSDNLYYVLTLDAKYTGADKRSLINNNYYGYEIILKDSVALDPYTYDIVNYTTYQVPTTNTDPYGDNVPIFHYIYYVNGTRTVYDLEAAGSAYIYAEYSTGNVRGYIGTIGSTVADPTWTIGDTYQVYANHYFSNWNYFQSRTNPTVVLQYDNSGSTANLPETFWQRRSITVNATYSQPDNISLRYHRWVLYSADGTIIDDSGNIYDSDFTYQLSPFDENATYYIELTTVDQNNVVLVTKTLLITHFTTVTFKTTQLTRVDSDRHYAILSWAAALSAVPSEDYDYSGTFGNNINIGTLTDYQLSDGELVYDSIGGSPFQNMPKNNIAFRTGFSIEDGAAAKHTEPYTQDYLIKLDFSDIGGNNDIFFEKEGYVATVSGSTFDLLDKTLGFSTSTADDHHYGEEEVWLEESNNWPADNAGKYWVETSSDTNVFYYEMLVNNNETTVKRTAFMQGETSANLVVGATTCVIPYNNLLYKTSNDSLKLLFKQDIASEGTTFTSISCKVSLVTSTTMTLTFSALTAEVPANTPYVLYEATSTEKIQATSTAGSNELIGIHFKPRINLYYTTLGGSYDNSTDRGNASAELGFGVKPDWSSDDKALIMLFYMNEDLSSKRGAGGLSTDIIYAYEVWRQKYKTLQDAENDVNLIYNKYLATIDLAQEGITALPELVYNDWTIENNGFFRYQIIPLGASNEEIIQSEPIQTSWYGWSFTSIQEENGHMVPVERWIYYLNLETKGYSHVTNKVFHQGFRRYPKVSVGTTDYITSDLTGLIGEFNQVAYTDSYGFYTEIGNYYTDDNIERIYAWENFINDGKLILVKDYKGRAYIAQLDGNAANFQDVEKEILTTTSFNITQIDSVDNFQIFTMQKE